MNVTLQWGGYPILKYIPKDWVVWCPFDTKESNFVKLISKQNKIIRSHISEEKISTLMNL